MEATLASVISSLVVVVGAATLAALAFQALRLPVVLGYMLTGVLIGPHGSALVTDTTLIGVLSALGVVLLFFTIGLEFSVRTIARVGLPTLLTVVIELSLVALVILGVARACGASSVEAPFIALGVAVASTMMVANGLEHHAVEPSAKELILALLVIEDMLSVLLLAILAAVASGSHLSPGNLAITSATLAGFLVGMIAMGMLLVPRCIRYVARSGRPDTLLVSSLAVCLAFVWLALHAGYSVALGAFLGGSLVAESGKAREIDQLVRPLRDAFAAVFFVSIGMTIVPRDLAHHWVFALVLALALVVVKTLGIAAAAFLTGNGLRRSIQAGLAMSQIGELSFIAIGIGIAAGPHVARPFLLSVVVAASCVTALAGSLLLRSAAPVATSLARGLPRSIATFVSFYESWITRLRSVEGPTAWRRVRRPVLGTLVDAVLLVVVVIGASALRPIVSAKLVVLGLDPGVALALLVTAALALGAVFAVAIARHAIRLATLLARDVIPLLQPDRDLGRAPRRVFELTLEIVILLLVGLPVAAITQPFVPGGFVVVVAVLAVVVLAARRSLTDLDHHVRAGAELIVELLARQGAREEPLAGVEAILPGLEAVPIALVRGAPAIDRSLAELDLRARTGASVLAITHDGGGAVNPSPTAPLREGDVLALTGSSEALAAARELLLGVARAAPA
jgi:CPA2 family monovalent cation:H+ antiporter-2